MQQRIMAVYERLLDHYGSRNWWPADTPFEVAVGAILTQNTSWKNVETAIDNLRGMDALAPAALAEADIESVREAVRPSRYYNQKASRIIDFARFVLDEFDGDITRLGDLGLTPARKLILSRKGVGPETADDILLYAANLPSFVVDTYTVRIFTRMGLTDESRYEPLRAWFMEHLPEDVGLFNEFHALIDAHGHHTCKPTPKCGECALFDICEKRL